MCIRPSCWDFWLFFQPWPTGSNHSIVFWKREYSTFTSLKESLKYSFIRTPFPASMQWLGETYAVVFILKSLDQKKHHSMEITFWHIKGEGEILWWKYWATIYFYAWQDSQISHDAFKKKNWFRAQATEKRGLLLWSTLKSNII